jgi:leader peptidase (prepilin peptidase)/N-methyltransferase
LSSLGEVQFALPFWYQLISFVILGAIWGSFVAALCSRWPFGEQISNGRSRCDVCQTTLAPKDLVPIFSFALLRGKCRYCRQSIGVGALYTELISAAIGLLAILLVPSESALAMAVFGWLLLPLIILDYQRLWLPNRLVIALAGVGTVGGYFLLPDSIWTDRVIGGVLGFLSLEAIRQGFRKIRSEEGMGGGDPKLFGAIGIWLGWQLLPMTLLLACLIGFVHVTKAYVRYGALPLRLPFGTFLSVAAFLLAAFH